MDLFKKPYEISLWEDKLVFVGTSGTPYEDIEKATEEIIGQYYKEVKLCIIGSNTMDSQSRCVNPKLVRKINGENTLTFTMYYRYIDNRTGEKIYNPFNKYMVNERKVKLRVGEGKDTKWYDFIIKNVQENSETCAFTYTCKDQFVNELSKTGFELVFDNELENNMGTVDYLAGKILEGSDWEVKPGDNLKQFVEEPLYKIGIDAALEGVKNLETGAEFTMSAFKEGEIRYIYAFYNQINNQESKLQFLYTEEADFKTNDDLIIDKVEHPNYIIENVGYNNDGWPIFAEFMDLSDNYRGMRLVRPVQTKYDSTIDKYVTVYEKGGEEYYGFIDTEYISPNTVSNYVVNPSAFTNTSGWYTELDTDGARATVTIETDPPISSTNLTGTFTSYLEFSNNGTKLMNTSIAGFRSAFKNGFVAEGEKSEGSEDEEIETGSKFIFRIKCKTEAEKPKTVQIGRYELIKDRYYLIQPTLDSAPLDGKEYWYCDDNDILQKVKGNEFIEGKEYYESGILFDFEEMTNKPPTNEKEQDEKFIYLTASCEKSVSVAELKNINNRYGLFLTFNGSDPIFIENAQLFPYVLSGGKLCVPGGDFDEVIKTTYKYYKPDPTWSSIDDLIIVASGEQPVEEYEPKYPEGASSFTKVRSISAKESNRYNLIQDLCEKFECWAKFSVDRDETSGEISMTQDPTTGVYYQNKYVQFQEYVGTPNHAGFRYGVNSKSIQRTLDSNAIISKMIVKDNANEFAPRGFCSIARASENPTKENFLISFDHYVRQGLLNMATVTNDLYLDSNGYLGYYKKLKRLNVDRDSWIDLQTNLSKDIMNYEASAQSYKKSYDAAVEERISIEQQIVQLVSSNRTISFQDAIAQAESDSKWPTETKYISLKGKWAQCRNIEQQHKPLYEKAETMRSEAQQKYDELAEKLKNLADEKRALNLQFYKKYSRFIQEGSWIKEDYVDDNLYYLDAESTLHTSTQPKVSYTINVIDLAQLGVQNQSDYSYYKFDIGDITYIEDTEFFGWSLIDGKTPYREEIVVSEITDELDAPEKNVIKVQNYKTQFEDLFQRITAQTQQAEYHTGEFKRAANVVQPGGTISFSVLENSFLNNAMRLENARDQSVVIDEYGITSTSLTNPSEMVRLVAGGIFMSTDGGQTWRTGITGTGINTSYLTAGQLNVDEIYIMSGSQPAFRWDKDGISAYTYSEIGNNRSYNLNKYVRFDQNGIYGRLGEKDEKDENYKDVNSIMKNAPFALTWDGFALNGDGGAVRITNEKDIQVLGSKTDDQGNQIEGLIERIKIGRLDENGTLGLRIKDSGDNIVMETNDKGQLWLRDKLHIGGIDRNVNVKIGKLEGSRSVEEKKDSDIGEEQIVIKEVYEVINANDNFIVYEDGHMVANSGYFKGTVNAGGTFTGHVEAESGIFKGELSAATGTFAGDISAATGTFKGDISAAQGTFGSLTSDGVFTGKLDAVTGTIGGFEIIKEDDQSLLRSISHNEQGERSIILNGSNGSIYAKNIKLGNGAEIEDYIQIGTNAKIYNPDKHSNLFIESGDLKIYNNGTANLGEIILDGTKSEIYGNSFSITKDLASFSNINCSGVIRTAVFEKGKVQGVGGAMLFKLSYKISQSTYNSSDDTLQIIPEKPDGEDNLSEVFISKAHVLLVGYEKVTEENKEIIGQVRKKGLILSADETDEGFTVKITSSNTLANFTAEMIVILGKAGSASIGINSTDSSFENLLYPRGLTIAEIGETGQIESPKLFLGDLETLKNALGTEDEFEGTLKGYGLYSNNVYLQGSIVSAKKIGQGTVYAGINTNASIASPHFTKEDTSPVIFWGGATALNAIDKASFQVTAQGSLYANRAMFENSIIAGADIWGSKIYAAEIHPKDEKAALKIYNTGLAEGIQFIKEKDDKIENDKEIITLAIDYQGLSAFGEYFINLDSSSKEIFFSLNGASNRLEIKDNEISMQNINQNSKIQGGFLHFEPDKISLGYGETESIKEKAIDISIAQIELLKATHFQSGIFYESNQYEITMEYRPTENGYDLYVS